MFLYLLFSKSFLRKSIPNAASTAAEKLKIPKTLLSEEVEKTGIFKFTNRSTIGVSRHNNKETVHANPKNKTFLDFANIA